MSRRFSRCLSAPDFPQFTTSVVSGRDLAKGTIRLPDTLRQVEAKLAPELIVVCASCSTILLQEDLQTVADSAHTAADVLVYDANPYRMQETTSAEGLFTELVRRFARPQPLTEQPSVNLLGPSSLGFHNRPDLICLRRILQTLGVQINVVAPWGASPADLSRLPAAWLNIAPYRELGLQASTYLEEQFGTPALREAPIGVQPALRWIKQLVQTLNDIGARSGSTAKALTLPPLTAFSLDSISAPSGVPWFARTADMESYSSKRAFVFGDATHTVGVTRFLHDELGMQIAGAGTYLEKQAPWVAEQLCSYLPENDSLLVTERFQDVAARIAELQLELVCGTQMERHACRKLDLPCMVIAPPTHIENHLLSYRPFLGFDGADVIADTVYTTATLGMEKHLIDLFGDAGLDYTEPAQDGTASNADQTARDADQAASTANQAASTANQAARTADQAVRAAEQMYTSQGQTTRAEDAMHAAANHTTAAANHTTAAAPGAHPPPWTAEATTMLKKVPFFVRNKVQRNVEGYAQQQGYAEITADVLLEAREALGG